MRPARENQRRWVGWGQLSASQLLLASACIVLLMQVELAFSKSINWDEFFHFSLIHRHLQGRPVQWLQVPFVWLYSWVPLLPGDNILHIQIIRLLTLPFEILAFAAIVATAQAFVSREHALFCGLLFLTGGYVFLHAFALRADMIAASLLSCALWVCICRPLRVREIAIVVLLVGLAFVSTIKSLLYAPAFIGAAYFRLRRPGHRRVVALSCLAAIAVGMLFLRLAPTLPPSGAQGVLRDVGILARDSAGRMFTAGAVPQLNWLVGQILRAPLLTIALAVTFASLFLRRDRDPAERLLQLSLLLPLCAVAVYHNAYPYFYAFILPPAVVAVAPAIAPLLRSSGTIAPALLLLALATGLSFFEDRDVLPRQRALQAGVHEIFRQPVTYIDDCGLIGDFPRAVNHFASGWALRNYLRRGEPAYRIAQQSETVPMLLADSGRSGTVCFDIILRDVLLQEDQAALRGNYIPHWGNVHVAGKHIAPGNAEASLDIEIPGTYTVENAAITIDGVYRPTGSVVSLARGVHMISGARNDPVTLRWGNHLPLPAFPWPQGTLLTRY